MCGIAGIISIALSRVQRLSPSLNAMSRLIAHRGPDGVGEWQRQNQSVGLVHRRLSIIDLSEAASQPMQQVKLPGQATQGSILEPPFEQASFDALVAVSRIGFVRDCNQVG